MAHYVAGATRNCGDLHHSTGRNLTVAAALVPQPQNVLTVVAQVAVMLVLSAASFHFLEDPVRKSNWLNNRGGSVDRVAVRRPISSGWSKVVFVGVGPACLALLATVVVSGVSPSVPAGAGATQDVKGLSVDPWCATAINSPKDCIAVRTPEQVEMQSAELGAVPSGAPNVSSLDTTSWFCDRDNRCPSFVGNTPVFADGSHLTENYSKMLGPVLRSALLDEAK
jgi:hypothetical protein